MPDFAVGAVIIADDVRKEVSNKEIIIGVYGGGIMVPYFPVTIPIALWMEITPSVSGHQEIDVRVTVPEGGGELRMRLVIDVMTAGEPTTFYTPSIHTTFGTEGIIEIAVKNASSDDDWMVVKTKRVLAGTAPIATPVQFFHGPPAQRGPEEATSADPTASPQPSGQSQRAARATRPSRVRRPRRGPQTEQTPEPE